MWCKRLYGVVILLLVIIELVSCDDATSFIRGNNIFDVSTKIINGEPASDGRYQYAQISIQYPGVGISDIIHHCGGSLIAPDIILTAAHCQNLIGNIYIDIYDLDTDEVNAPIYTAKNITVHPQFYAALFRYDFAVIHLQQQVDTITPVRLNSDASIPLPTSSLTVLGWGATQAGTATTNVVNPSIIHKGNVQAMTNANCAATVIEGYALYTGEIFDEMLCAEGLGVDACAGDSGGPLIAEGGSAAFDVQVGIVSWGRGCAIYPGVYSRISTGYDWIRSEVCYKSINPPSYLGCLPEERDPIYKNVVVTAPFSPWTRAPVRVTGSPVTPRPVLAATTTSAPSTTPATTIATTSFAPTTLYPTTFAPTTKAPTTKTPTKRPTIRPSRAPSIEPVVVAKDGGRPTPYPWNTTISNVLDSQSSATSSARNDGMISYQSLFFTIVCGPLFWSIYR